MMLRFGGLISQRRLEGVELGGMKIRILRHPTEYRTEIFLGFVVEYFMLEARLF